MAQITDNAHTRWGRRIPFILTGGVARVLFLVAVFVFFPRAPGMKSNAEFKRLEDGRIAQYEAAAQNEETATDGGVTVEPASPVKKHRALASSSMRCLKFSYLPQPIPTHATSPSIFCSHASSSHCLARCNPCHITPSASSWPRPTTAARGVVVYRAFVDKAMSLVGPWILPFIFLPVFINVIDGLVWYAVFVCLIGIPTTVAMCMVVKERGYHPEIKRPQAPPILKSIWLTAKNIHFLKILFLYVFMGLTNGIFLQVGSFLTLFYVFRGNIVQGGVMNGYATVIAVILGFATLPLINWASHHLGKHRALRYAIVWMSFGAASVWFLYNPAHPYLILIHPFFWSIGIGSVYTILPSLMADVTDIDELENGVRREGMFGAVMAFLSKALLSVQPVLAASVLLASGFDASLGADQPPEVFAHMRLLASFVPAGLLLFAIVVLFHYPLTRARMAEVKATIAARRAAATAAI
jgi:Na+/melibiose symporter-like transporter